MSENLPSQFPKSPDLHPLSPVHPQIGQTIGLILILSGLTLLGWGSWLFYQYQLEANRPPPVRILEVSVTGPAEKSSSLSSQTDIKPTATLPKVSNISVAEPVNTSTPPSTVAPPAASGQELTSMPEPGVEAVPSLADNPLPVAEAEEPAPAEAKSAAGTTPLAVSPPTRIVADRINLDAPVIEVGWKQVIENGISTNVWEVADYAAGWHKNSLLPGQGGNIVLSGHHNIKGEVFRYLVDLKPGDVVTLYVGEQPYDYVVADIFILKDKGEPEAVRRENSKWIGPFNEERLTLVTCWPYTNNTHRLIVIARPLKN